MTQPDAKTVIDFALELVDRLDSAHLPWTVQKLATHQRIVNGAGTLIAETYDAAAIVPELIVRVVNALPVLAVEFGLEPREGKCPP